jgi:hypothetical protein
LASRSNSALDAQVGLLRDPDVTLAGLDGTDLSARQLGVFRTCYLNDGPQTVRDLAAELDVSRQQVTGRSGPATTVSRK